jgi:hypothetical protein
MRLISLLTCLYIGLCAPLVSALNLIESNSLNLCQDSTNFTATYFSVTFTPNNRSLAFAFDGVAAISGKVTAELVLTAYGYTALRKSINPCDSPELAGLCPMSTGPIDVPSANIVLPDDVVSQIPREFWILLIV